MSASRINDDSSYKLEHTIKKIVSELLKEKLENIYNIIDSSYSSKKDISKVEDLFKQNEKSNADTLHTLRRDMALMKTEIE